MGEEDPCLFKMLPYVISSFRFFNGPSFSHLLSLPLPLSPRPPLICCAQDVIAYICRFLNSHALFIYY